MGEIAQAAPRLQDRKSVKGPVKCRPGKGSCAMLSAALAETGSLLPSSGGAGLGVAIRIVKSKTSAPIYYSTGKSPRGSSILIDFCPWCGVRLSEAQP